MATIFSAVIAFVALLHQISTPGGSSRRRRGLRLNRNEVLLILSILLFFLLGLAVPQAILPVFLCLIIVVYRNIPRSIYRARYTLSVLAVTLAGLVGAYLSAYPVAADAGLPIFYSRAWRVLDIWYLLN
ncbi:MAG: hypothetical protein R3F54_04640 [Alphaproteobacteria bacterium]